MSLVNFEELKSPRDPNIPFLTRVVNFTTAQLTLDSLQQFGRLIKSFRVANEDVVNTLTIRTKSPSGIAQIIEAATEAANDDWTSFLQITPNGVTGSGLIELELVDPKDAKRV
jgi:hypothetical protein